MNPESRTILPKMAFTGFASRYREPTEDEGFQDITKVNFQVRFWRSLGHAVRAGLQLALWISNLARQFNGTEAQKEQWRKYWIS